MLEQKVSATRRRKRNFSKNGLVVSRTLARDCQPGCSGSRSCSTSPGLVMDVPFSSIPVPSKYFIPPPFKDKDKRTPSPGGKRPGEGGVKGPTLPFLPPPSPLMERPLGSSGLHARGEHLTLCKQPFTLCTP